MGTYYLLFDKGPATLPVVALLLAACTCVPLTDPLGGRLLRHLAPLGCLSWAAYILHVPLSTALSDLDDDAFNFLWLKPLCMLLIIGAAHVMVARAGDRSPRLSSSRSYSTTSRAPPSRRRQRATASARPMRRKHR